MYTALLYFRKCTNPIIDQPFRLRTARLPKVQETTFQLLLGNTVTPIIYVLQREDGLRHPVLPCTFSWVYFCHVSRSQFSIFLSFSLSSLAVKEVCQHHSALPESDLWCVLSSYFFPNETNSKTKSVTTNRSAFSKTCFSLFTPAKCCVPGFNHHFQCIQKS